MDRVRLVLYSSQPALAAGVRSIFSSDPCIEISDSVHSVQSLWAALEAKRPNLLLVDYCYDATPRLLAEIRGRFPNVAIAVWMHQMEVVEAQYLSELGVRGFLAKDSSCEDLRKSLLTVAAGELSMPPGLMQSLLKGRRVHLSRREWQLLYLLSQGMGNKRMADRLNIQEGTVKVYLSRLFRKMEVNDRFELALCALKHFRNQGAVPISPLDSTEDAWLRYVILEPKEAQAAARAAGAV